MLVPLTEMKKYEEGMDFICGGRWLDTRDLFGMF